MLGSRWVNGKELRRGFTTGTCAAAAAQAAVEMLFTAEKLQEVEVQLPGGIRLNLPLARVRRAESEVSCAIRKIAGDDPDVTDGILVWATAKQISRGIILKGGRGIGRVTKGGLPVEVGESAINPVPRKMILEGVSKVLPPEEGVEITLSIPGGEEIAAQTFNPRLGIVGGLSILGTTGIVEPMSEEAWKDSLRMELQVLAKEGHKGVILVPGNYGQAFAFNELGLRGKPLVKMSNYVGFVLKNAEALGFDKALIVGDMGKLIKVSAGIFYTHSRAADARMEILSAYAALLGAGKEVIEKLLNLNTTTAALGVLTEEGLEGVYPLIAQRVSRRCQEYTAGTLRIGTVLFSNSRGLLALDNSGNELLEWFGHE